MPKKFISILLSLQACLSLGTLSSEGLATELEQTPTEAQQNTTSNPTPTVIDAAGLGQNTSLNTTANSTTIIDFANSQHVSIGEFINNGTLVFASSNPAINSGSIFATSMLNQSGANIFSSPASMNLNGLFPITNLLLASSGDFINRGSISAAGDLSIQTAGQIINTGTITSNSNLNMTASGLTNSQVLSALQNVNLQIANIQNSGQILAALGNISIANTNLANTANNLTSSLTASLSSALTKNIINELAGAISINNVAGTLNASNGTINIRDVLYSGNADLTIEGGNIVCRELNINNGNGNINAHLASITGVVSTVGAYAALSVQDQNLVLGNLQISGDPTYFNNAGDITISGNIQVGAALAIIAAKNIITTNAVDLITTTDGTGKGHNIYMVAGANITAGTGSTNSITTTPPVNGAATAPVTIDMVVPGLGGEIDLAASPNLTISSASTCAGCSAGNIVLAAFNDGAATGGLIKMASPAPGFAGTRIVSSSASGLSGNISIFAGAQTGNNVIGSLDARGSSPGSIRIAAAQPASSNGKSIQFDTTGEISSKNFFVAGATTNSNIHFHNNVNAGTIDVSGGGNIDSISGIIAQVLTAGNQPNATAINPAGTFVYTVDSVDSILSRISTTSNTVLNSTTVSGVGSSPLSIAISPDGLRIYVADANLNLLHVYDATTLAELAAPAPTGANPRSLAFSNDGKQLFVANHNSNTISVHDPITLLTTQVIPTTGTPISVIYNTSNSTIYAALDSNNTLFGFDMLNSKALVPVALAAIPTSIGRCPCGTKLFVSAPQSGLLQGVSLIGAPIVDTPIANGNQINGMAITPNGSYAYMTEPTAGQVSIVQTLTSSVFQNIPLAVNGQVSGDYAGFVGSNPVAYIPNGKQVAVIQTPMLLAQNISLTSGARIGVGAGAAGANTNLTSASNGATVVTSIGNLVSTGASTKAGPLQYATTNNITFNGNVTAPLADFHAMYGTFTNNAQINITGPVLALAAPIIVNNGSMELTGVTAARTFFQSPSGNLQVTLGTSASQIVSKDGTNTGFIDFNPAKGLSVNVSGPGTLSANGATRIEGNEERFKANINIGSLTGGFRSLAKPEAISITTQTGNIDILQSINTSSLTKSGGNILVQALGGAILTAAAPPAVNLNSDSAGGPGTRAGNITLISKNGVFINGEISAKGSNGASGGSIVISTSGNVAQCNCGTGGISASSVGGNGGSVFISGQQIGIYGLNPDNSSINVSSDVAVAGTIAAQSQDSINRLTVGCPNCNGFAGALNANGVSGGRINLATQSGLEVKSGLTVSANGSTGSGGVIQVLGVPGQTLSVVNDGSMIARNTADNSGVVGFNSYFEGGVNLTSNGGGIVHGGNTVAFGNLDSSTGLPINAAIFPASANFIFGTISANQAGSIIGNTISVGRAPLPAAVSVATPRTSKAPEPTFIPPNLLANTTIIPTDQTPEALQTTIRNFPANRSVYSDTLVAALAYTSDARTLASQGISAVQGPNSSLVLNSGNVLFIAHEKITIHTKLATVELNPGNIVFITADDGTLNVLNLHDDYNNSPVLSVDNRSTRFEVGQAMLVSRGNHQANDSIAYRQEELLFSNETLNVRSAQFSWTSAISTISKLKALLSSEQAQERRAIAQILKNAAIFSLVGNRMGPYK
ncbi:MAG: beta-propeller fold lactonase family protein [Candidatus Obscuribacterales bacterium]|nr:beta-propeller fold lactonase family protein [Candidatus Obscuribacterales bacterium]